MELRAFFDSIRSSVFNGKLSDTQVSGIQNILTYRATQWPKMSNDELAYLLATVAWETAWKMQPIREMGSEAYLRSKKYYPWVGEGLVQVTWETNARKFGAKKPGDLLKWPIALDAAFRGMITGMFTGAKLSDFIGNGKRDYVNARRIINGTDKAKEIAAIAESFRKALALIPATVPEQPTVPVDEFKEKLLAYLKNDIEIQNIIKDITT